MSSMDALLEAERRGILPADKKAVLDEARKRGIVPALPEKRSFKELLYENVVGKGAIDTPGERLGSWIGENLTGSGEVDTPGERLGQLIRGAGAATARGIADVPAFPANIAQLGTMGVEKALGMETGSSPVSQSLASLPDTREAFAKVPVIGPESRYEAPGRAGKFISAGGEAMGAGGLLGGPKALIAAAGSGLGSEAGGQLAEGTKYETPARIVGALAGAGVASTLEKAGTAIVDQIRKGALRKAFTKNVDSVEKLKTSASSLYDDARAKGVTATPAQTKSMADSARATLQSEGAITPKGRIVDYPKIKHAINTLDDYADAPMTPTEILTVRRALQDAAGSVDKAEARLGTILRNQFDEATSPLAPQIAKANSIYARMAQGELVEKTIELAGSKAGQFTGSGFENALRSEFRSLERKIIRGTVRASTDETAMISHIARGGPLENLLRDVGKAAPTGVVSSGLSAGVPFYIGNTLGGPAVGGALAVGVPAVGGMSRSAATKLQSGNADFLSALARAGGKAPAGLMPSVGQGMSLPRDIIGPALPGLLATQSDRR